MDGRMELHFRFVLLQCSVSTLNQHYDDESVSLLMRTKYVSNAHKHQEYTLWAYSNERFSAAH